MSRGLRSELVRLGTTLIPAFACMVVGLCAITAGPFWLGLALGGGMALLLVLFGGLIVAGTHNSALHFAALAALASLVVRIGGAGAMTFIIDGKPWSFGAIIGLAGGLLAAIALDVWYRVARTDALMTSAKESVRA
jgi:hypothetical protein